MSKATKASNTAGTESLEELNGLRIGYAVKVNGSNGTFRIEEIRANGIVTLSRQVTPDDPDLIVLSLERIERLSAA